MDDQETRCILAIVPSWPTVVSSTCVELPSLPTAVSLIYIVVRVMPGACIAPLCQGLSHIAGLKEPS